MPIDRYMHSDRVGLYNKQVVRAALSFSPLAAIKIEGYMNNPDEYEIFCPVK